jgi:quercetin dioxygenase-like cupin family protein
MIHDDTVTSQPLLSATTAWNGSTYAPYPAGVPELTVRRVTIPAHTALSWHSHPMPSAAYLVAGELTVEEPGGARRRMVAGEAFAESVETEHRGVAGDEPAVVIVFYEGVQGMPLTTARML